MNNFENIISTLHANANPNTVKGMEHYGIKVLKAFGVSLPFLRDIAKHYQNDHPLAIQLWDSGFHEARMLATMVDDASQVTEAQMEAWVLDFDSWDICDQCCSNLFDKTPFALKKLMEWTFRDEEYVKRAGFVMMACLAVHSTNLPDTVFEGFLPVIVRESTDPRNFVCKAVNWALRQIGKRDMILYAKALEISRTLANSTDKTARWIGNDAVKELQGTTAIKRMLKKDNLLKDTREK